MSEKMHKQIVLTFEQLFSTRTPKSVEEYLKGGDKKIVLNAATYFTAIKGHGSVFNELNAVVKLFFGPQNNEYAKEILVQSKLISNTSNISFFNIWSSLKLFETFFQINENDITQSDSEFERNLFEAYLVFNSEFTRKQSTAFSSVAEIPNNIRLSALYFSMHFIIADKINVNLHEMWLTQTIKSIYLFQFLNNDPRFSNILEALLLKFDSVSWKEYLKEIIHLAGLLKQGDIEKYTDIKIEENDRFQRGCMFLDKLSMQENDPINQFDFLTLRGKPFYKIDEGVYRVIYKPFAIDKIFTGQYFVLKEIKNEHPKITSFDLRSELNYKFSEKVMVYTAIKSIFPDKGIHFTGDEMHELNMDGEPDYYLRLGNKILLFESKDFLIRAEIKDSCDFRLIEPELKKRLHVGYNNGKPYNGAVLQLINNISLLLTKEFYVDTDYHYRNIYIYPILIIHQPQFDTGGLNFIVNSWLQEELIVLREQGYFVNRVKPITIINIDDLLLFENGLRDNLNLYQVIDLYHESIKILPRIKFKESKEAESYLLRQLLTFSTFIKSEFHRRKIYSTPKAIEDMKLELFSDDLVLS